MKEVTLDALAEIGTALSHSSRLRIMTLLRESDLYVCQIRAVLQIAASTLSVQLSVLRNAGLVTEQKQGRFILYGLTREEPLGSVVREILYLIGRDQQILDDARALAAIRRIAPDALCRMGLDLNVDRERRGCPRRAPSSLRRPAITPRQKSAS
jgi:ArsR family transcriptional regulator, arsenate/arsenite/antimonite-responsive transcriptional repressor